MQRQEGSAETSLSRLYAQVRILKDQPPMFSEQSVRSMNSDDLGNDMGQEEPVIIPAGVVSVPLQLKNPPGLVTRYATNFVVQMAEHECIISFYEAQPPLQFVPGGPPITAMPAECVGRIIVAPGRLPELIRILQESINIREQARVSAQVQQEEA